MGEQNLKQILLFLLLILRGMYSEAVGVCMESQLIDIFKEIPFTSLVPFFPLEAAGKIS